MSYTHTNRASFKTQLAQRLGDESRVYFTDSELNLYTNEALRLWNCASQMNRERGIFQTAANQVFYDLSTVLRNDTDLLLARSVKDRDCIDLIVSHFVESVDANYVWTGTDMFTLSDLTNAIQRRVNQFLLETGMVLTTDESTVVTSGQSRVTLSDSIIDIRRVAFKTIEGAYSNLWRTDEQELQLLYPRSWSTDTATPQMFSEVLVQPRALRLAPVPVDTGNLHLITVNTGATLDPSTGVVLGVIDDWMWVIKYGAMADLLLTEASASDTLRAEYCQQRWKEGIILAQIASSVLYAEINGVPVSITDLFDLDTTEPTWQNPQTTLDPTYLMMAGHNLCAMYPAPAITTNVPTGQDSIVLDVVRNAPLPTSDADYIQVGREHLNTLISYIVHLASFKMGMRDIQETFSGYSDLLEAAALHSNRLRAESHLFDSMNSRTRKEETPRPRVKAA